MRSSFKKYLNSRVPRYTSYPTALQFSDAVGEDVYKDWLGAVKADQTLSLYVHVPFCEQLCYYCGCNTMIPNGYERAGRYVTTLLTEIDRVAEHLTHHAGATHIHFGGGTPSYLTAEDFKIVLNRLTDKFPAKHTAQIAVEMDPRTVDAEKIAAMVAGGVNRASLGVQDFDAKVQELINRVQPFEMVEGVVNELRRQGINHISFDLMYGLPGQVVKSVIDTAEKALTLRPNRISLFGYAHVPWFKKHQQLLKEEMMPDADERLAQADAAAKILLDADRKSVV